MAPRRILPAGFVEPCITTLAHKPPSGPDWVHEIKHDGYRPIVCRDGKAVHLFTRRGFEAAGQAKPQLARRSPIASSWRASACHPAETENRRLRWSESHLPAADRHSAAFRR
jgi:hypothetical protein